MRLGRLTVLAVLAVAFAACMKDNPNYCGNAPDAGFNCLAADAAAHTEHPAPDAGDASDGDAHDDAADAADASDSKTPICVGDNDCVGTDAGTPACEINGDAGARCVECTKNTHCSGDKPVCDTKTDTCVQCTGEATNATLECKTGVLNLCDTTALSCVECLGNSNCSGAKPICDGKACRACKADAECGSPGICLDTGACATDTQTVFVEYNSNACPNADGTTSKPYCKAADAVAALVGNKSVIVIRGPIPDQLSFSSALAAPVTVVGRMNGTGEPPTIPLTVATGISVTAGAVIVRDLNITGGTSTSATGVLVNGVNVSLTIRRVSITTGKGTGVQTAGSATLVMDQCVVKDKSEDGLVVDSASYTVTNSAFINNGSGVRFTNTKGTQQFVLNTIVNSTGNAATCDLTNAQKLSASIVAGHVASCVPDNCVTTAPAFDSSGYHLTGHLSCPSAAPSTPNYDIDGDLRSAPIDCGADQFR